PPTGAIVEHSARARHTPRAESVRADCPPLQVRPNGHSLSTAGVVRHAFHHHEESMRTLILSVLFGIAVLFTGCGKKDSASSSEKSPDAVTHVGLTSDKDAVQGRWALVKIDSGEPD